MRELKRLLFRGSLVRFYPDWRPHRQSGAHVTGLVPGIGPAIHVFVAGIETDMDIRPSQPHRHDDGAPPRPRTAAVSRQCLHGRTDLREQEIRPISTWSLSGWRFRCRVVDLVR